MKDVQGLEEKIERAKELGLTFYAGQPIDDIYFAKWYNYMIESGEYETVFTQDLRALSDFLNNFRLPRITVYEPDEDTGCKLAAWFVPFDGGSCAFMNLWLHKDARRAMHNLKVTQLVYDIATEQWEVIIGVTKHEHLLRIHRKIGYNIVGKIPKLLEGNDAWILYLTRELFEKGMFKTKLMAEKE